MSEMGRAAGQAWGEAIEQRRRADESDRRLANETRIEVDWTPDGLACHHDAQGRLFEDTNRHQHMVIVVRGDVEVGGDGAEEDFDDNEEGS